MLVCFQKKNPDATNMGLYLLFKFTVPNNVIILKTRTLIPHA